MLIDASATFNRLAGFAERHDVEGGFGCGMISAALLTALVPAALAGTGKGSDDMGCVFIECPLPLLVQRLMARLAR